MQFINPRTDYAFKRIFGSEESKPILQNFLNAFLYEEQEIIQSLEIIDPYLAPKLRGMKDTFVDVQATLANGTQVIIEMQVLNVPGFEKRILYNAAKKYSTQLVAGSAYDNLTPIIALTITDFIMFDGIDALKTRYVLKEKDFLSDYLAQDIQLVFLELPKFSKTLEQIQTTSEKWLYFLRFADDLHTIPEQFRTPNAMEHAFVIANRAQIKLEDLNEIENREMFIRAQKGAITKSFEQGKHEQALETARNLLPFLSDEIIAQTTGLSINDILRLRAS